MATKSGNRGQCYRCKRRIVGEMTGAARCAALCWVCVKYVWHDFVGISGSDFCDSCGLSAWSAFGAHNGTTVLDHLNATMYPERLAVRS